MEQKFCDHIPNLDLLKTSILIGTHKETIAQVGECRYQCKKCLSVIKFDGLPSKDIREAQKKIFIKYIRVASPVLLILIGFIYYLYRTLDKRMGFIAAPLPLLIILLSNVAARLRVSHMFLHGSFGNFSTVSKNQDAKLRDFDELVHSKERVLSTKAYIMKGVRCVLILGFLICAIAGLIWLLAMLV